MIRDMNALQVRTVINISDVPSQRQVEDWAHNREKIRLIKAFRGCYQDKEAVLGGEYCSLIDAKHTVENAMEGHVTHVCLLFVPAWIHFKIKNDFTRGQIPLQSMTPLCEKIVEAEAFCKKMKFDNFRTRETVKNVVEAHFIS